MDSTLNPNDPWIQTFTGKKFYPKHVEPDDICIEDIAHALSLLCRFGGHCTDFYSVAAHSLNVADMLPVEYKLLGLLHDATEAYLIDVPRPIKLLLPEYNKLEAEIWEAIAEKYDLPHELPEIVHTADRQMLHTEREQLMMPQLAWNIPDNGTRGTLWRYYSTQAEQHFLSAFKTLSAARPV